MDRVIIEQLEVATTIGVYDWEKSIRQCLLINLEIAWNNSIAAKDDDLNKALDYVSIVEIINRFSRNSHFNLIETFAEKLAELLKKTFNINWLKISVIKPGAIPQAKGVGVIIERN